MQMIYGYCRISTKKQNIERQERNILAAYPKAHIYKERYTGTKTQGRKALDKIVGLVRSGDTIVFDSVSRMSRNAAEGVELYMDLFNKDVELVFLKEPFVNTSVYREKIKVQVSKIDSTGSKATDRLLDTLMKALHDYTIELAREQIELAFRQAQKEVDDLHKSTAEGIETARRNGKQIGTPKGAKLTIKKKAPALEFISKHSRAFGGELNDTQCAAAAKICRKTFYKYKVELQELLDKEK